MAGVSVFFVVRRWRNVVQAPPPMYTLIRERRIIIILSYFLFASLVVDEINQLQNLLFNHKILRQCPNE